MKKQNMIPLQELNLADRFLFDEVMEDPQAHREILSIILGREIPPLKRAETEKEVRVSSLARSIRLDVFTMDENTDETAQTANSERIHKIHDRVLAKGKTAEEIADALEEDVDTIRELISSLTASPT